MAYALAADLSAYMKGQTLDADAATLILQMVADAMDAEMGLDPETWGAGTVTVGEDTYTGALLAQTVTEILDGPAQGSSLLVLPGHPVRAVTDVQVQDTLGTWSPLTYQTDYLWSSAGILTRIRSRLGSAPLPGYYPGPPLEQVSILPLTPIWPAIPQGVMASYTRGFASVPQIARTVNITAAARVYANPTGVTGETVGGYSVRYSPRGDGGIGGISFNALEESTLIRLAEKVVG